MSFQFEPDLDFLMGYFRFAVRAVKYWEWELSQWREMMEKYPGVETR